MNRLVSRSLSLTCALTLAILLVTTSASADATERDATLTRDTTASQRWYFGWLAFLTAATAVNGTLWATADDAGVRAQARVGTVVGGIGLVARVLVVPPSLFASPPYADDLLTRRADAERFGRSVLAHVGGVLLNGAGGLYLWLHDDSPARAAILFGSGVLVGEIMIFTQPTIAMDAAESSPANALAKVRVDVAPMLLKRGAGLSLSVTY